MRAAAADDLSARRHRRLGGAVGGSVVGDPDRRLGKGARAAPPACRRSGRPRCARRRSPRARPPASGSDTGLVAPPSRADILPRHGRHRGAHHRQRVENRGGGRRQGRGRRHGRHPRVDEDGDPGRGRRRRDRARRSAARRARRSAKATSSSCWSERAARRRQAPPRLPRRGGRPHPHRQPGAPQRARPRDPRHAGRDAAAARPGDRDPLRADHRRAARSSRPATTSPRSRAETFERDAEALVAHPFHAAMEALAAHPWPTVAAINGHCLGGGLELAITCDLRICAAGAKLGMPPAKLGLVYGHTGLRKFLDTRRAGPDQGAVPDRAQLRWRSAPSEIGLVHEVVGDERLRGRGGRAGRRDRRQRAALDAGQQARDRPAQPPARPQRAAGGRPDRAARVLLRLRGPARGNQRLRREAQAASGRDDERRGCARGSWPPPTRRWRR